MNAPAVGSAGRTVTQVGATGLVAVLGVSYHAVTAGDPIPVNEPVTVTGWRADPQFGVVLFVARPADVPLTGPVEVFPPQPDWHPQPQPHRREVVEGGGHVAAGLWALSVLVLIATPLVELVYPPWQLCFEWTVTQRPDTLPGREPQPAVTVTASAGVARLGHHWVATTRGDGEPPVPDQSVWAGPAARVEVKRVVRIDWNQLLVEGLVALAVSAGLRRMAGWLEPPAGPPATG